MGRSELSALEGGIEKRKRTRKTNRMRPEKISGIIHRPFTIIPPLVHKVSNNIKKCPDYAKRKEPDFPLKRRLPLC
jgi:hypothetical protein